MSKTTSSTVSFDPEIRNRIRLAVAAYAYEIEDSPIMSDAEFDKLSRSIEPRRLTGAPILDLFFLETFEPHTGSWVHEHPELGKIAAVYRQHYQ